MFTFIVMLNVCVIYIYIYIYIYTYIYMYFMYIYGLFVWIKNIIIMIIYHGAFKKVKWLLHEYH